MCVAGGIPIATGSQVVVVKRTVRDRTELWACRRGSRRPLALGATFRNGTGTSGGARSALLGLAAGGSVAAAAFVQGANGCIYDYGCADAPRRLLKIADVVRRTVRRLPLSGAPTAITVSPAGSVTFRVDEFLCLSTYRTTAAIGAPVDLVRRVAARVGGPAAGGLCTPA